MARKPDYFQTTNYWNVSASMEALQFVRRKLAKRANQRMVRLERSASPISGKAYHVGAYDIAQAELGDRKRFSEKLDYITDITDLKKEIGQLQAFLNAKSSTVAGNKEIEEARVATLTDLGRDEEGHTVISEATARSAGFYDFISSKAFIYLSEKQVDSEGLQEIYDYYTEKKGLTYKEVQDLVDEYYKEVQKDENRVISFREIAEKLDAIVTSKEELEKEQQEQEEEEES